MSAPVRRHRARSLFPDMSDVFESLHAWPPMWGLSTETGTHPIRIEDYTEPDKYVVRAEMPGIDPENDVDITVDEHLLTIRAERSEEKKDKRHNEFRYGMFTRTVSLPAGAREDEISANYDNGVLTVTVPLTQQPDAGRHIPVQHD